MRDTSGTDGDIETEIEGSYDTAPSQLDEDGHGKSPTEEPIITNLLSHFRTNTITEVDTWELQLGETVKRGGATSVGVGAGVEDPGHVDTSLTPINSDLTLSLPSKDSNSQPPSRWHSQPAKKR